MASADPSARAPSCVRAQRLSNGTLYLAGNASHPIALPRHDGCCRVTPLRPHRAHLADWRSLLLEAFGPHRMINGTIATGALCRQAELVQ
jgi:hypothetical protein